MQDIPKELVRGWTEVNGFRAPTAVSHTCPHCNEKVTFSLSGHGDDRHRLTIAASASCPACSKRVHFWAIRVTNADKTDLVNPLVLYMYPPVTLSYPMPKLPEDVPEALRRSLITTVDSYNQKNYPATAVCARRTLEGIFKFRLPEAKRNERLADLIDAATKTVDFAEPLTMLSHAIRDGGNLGAHFDAEKEPTEAMARQMVELVEYLISYLYVLPKEIRDLEKSLGKDA